MTKQRAKQMRLDGEVENIKSATMSEGDIQRGILTTLPKLEGVRVWRNNVGTARTYDGRFIRFGLCEGSSDLIGFVSKTITPDMVGKNIAVFAAIEVKAHKGKVSIEQDAFLGTVAKFGGISAKVRA